MIFISNSQGNIIGSLPNSIYQGSNGANEIILFAPFTAGSAVTVAIRLPNGQYISPKIADNEGAINRMSALGNFGALYDADGNSLNAWRLTLLYPLTQYAGELTFSFYIHTGEVIVITDRITQGVVATVPYLDPDLELDDYAALMAAISAARIIADNAQDAADAAQTAASEAQLSADNAQDAADAAQLTASNALVSASNSTLAAETAQNTADTAQATLDAFKLEVSRDYAKKSDISSIYRYRGSVNTFEDLPDNASVGDVYDVKAAYGANPAGTNYAWNGTEWDALGGLFDTSTITYRVDVLEARQQELESAVASEIDRIDEDIQLVDEKITALDDRTTANEDEIENINYILEQFGAVSQQVVQSKDNYLIIPAKANKVAHINSFGGMTYRKLIGFPKYTENYYNLLPYPYASIIGDGTEVNGYVYNLPWEYGGVTFVMPGNNSLRITESGTYRFKANATGSMMNPLIALAYTKADGTDNSEYINGDSFERVFDAGDIITLLTCGADWGSDASQTFSMHPVMYQVVYYYEEDGTRYQASPDVPFEPVVYELENAKIQKFETLDTNGDVVSTIPIPENIQSLENYGVGVTGYTNPVDVVEDVFVSNTRTINLSDSITPDWGIYRLQHNGVYYNGVILSRYEDVDTMRSPGICTHAVINYADAAPGTMSVGRFSTGNIIWFGILDILGISTIEEFKEWITRQATEGHPVTLIYGTDNPTTTPLSEPFDGLIEDVTPGGQVKCTTDTGAAAPFEVEFQVIGGS